jgi:O-antigen ligase
VTGVTTQKNSLGAMILVCLLVFFWDWLEQRRPGLPPRPRLERFAALLLAVTGAWLLHASDSKTAMTALAVAAFLIIAARLPVLRRRISWIGIYLAALVIGGFIIDKTFGISESLVANLGRDMTFTGRTDVWRELLNVGTDPFFGTGFMSFWDDMSYRERLPEWIAYSAHSGYIEVYLAGGWLGVGFLSLMLLAVAVRINRALAGSDDYTVVRFAIFVAVLMANFSESNFACMTPVGFLFLIAAIGHAKPQLYPESVPTTFAYPSGYPRSPALHS